MSANVSKQECRELTKKINLIRKYIARAGQDENTCILLTWLSGMEKEINTGEAASVFGEYRKALDEILETYTPVLNGKKPLSKNVYKDCRGSAKARSVVEKEFERYCENNRNVDWFYRNGDSGQRYFCIVCDDETMEQQHTFCPDYVVSVKTKIWIIKTGERFSRTGGGTEKDSFSSPKFQYLVTYIRQNNLRGGFVRKDSESGGLFICQTGYRDETGGGWELLTEVF
ncbi:MAG: hypothetical protein LBK13_05705 [Spirochaetales bacterium]|jgi:type III restriction enzyme|nr:hypothetical protein [Spirochaetales bacterium]